MSTHKKKITLSNVTVKLGCGSSCRRPKLSSVFNPKPRRHHHYHLRRKADASTSTTAAANYSNYSTSSWDTTTTTFSPAYYSSDTDADIKSLRAVQGFGRIGGESVAVEKDSDDPYLDFRQSMLQMILEKNIYSKDDLKELLNCFLQLNSPCYHGVIVRAFTEIWNGVYSVNQPPEQGGGGVGWTSRDF